MIARIFNSAVFMLHVALVADILVCASSALAATALTSNTADDLNSDVAIDGSGNVHLVLRDPSTGLNEAWYMDGTKRIGDSVKLPTAPPPWEGMTGYK